MKNALNWFEIPVTDFNRAKKFYETIFNYHMMVLDLGENFKMGYLPADQQAVGGTIVFHPGIYIPSSTDGPMIYLNGNPDLDEFLNRVEVAGGKVLFTKRQISPQFGYMGIFIDTEGNRMALHSTA